MVLLSFFFPPELSRAAGTQDLAKHKKLRLLGNTAGQAPLHWWQISKESQRQVIYKWKNCQPL